MSGCPVYNIDKSESHVARGRNMLIQMFRDKKIEADKSYKSALYYCLLCGRCESVCMAKIATNAITLNARNEYTNLKGLPLIQRIIFRLLLKHRSFFAKFSWILSFLPGFTIKEGKPIRHFPDMISALFRGISSPRFSVPFLSKRIKKYLKTTDTNKNTDKPRIAFFAGCVFEFIFADAGMEIFLLLKDAGYSIEYPEQTCCALPVYASGDFRTARFMAKRNIESLSEFDYIVTGCASCGSTLKSYVNWFDDEETKQKAQDILEKVRDVSEFLVQQDYKPEITGNEKIKVTYHDPCHLKWKQGISAEPRKFLKGLPNVEFIEMENPDACCGLGGSFALTHPEASSAIQAKKIESIKNTGADVVVTSCPGCMIQLMDGIKRKNLPVKVMHINQLANYKNNRGS